MARIEWSAKDARNAQGVSRGVLYLGGVAVPWNGLVSVEELDNSTIDTSLFIDGKRHRLSQDTGNFSANVQAFTYPEEFEPYDGFDDFAKHQERQRFGMTYRNELNDGYELHLVYNALVYPNTKSHTSITGNSDISPFSWTLVTTGVDLTWTKSASHLVVNSLEAHPTPFAQLENYIYGTASSSPWLPSPSQVIEMFESYTTTRVDYFADGSVQFSGPDYAARVVDEEEGLIRIDLPTGFKVLDDDTFIFRSNWEGG